MDHASLLEGRIRFGSPDCCPPDMDLIIDTRDVRDKPYEQLQGENVRCFAIWPYFEPEVRIKFEEFMDPIIEACKEGKKLYIVDPDGTERSAMVAWYTLFKVKVMSIEDAFRSVNLAYKMRTNRPSKWADVQVPRFERQRLFCRYELWDTARQNFDALFKHKAIHSRIQKAARSITGKIRSGQIVNVAVTICYCDPMLDGFTPIRLVPRKTDDWKALSLDYVGPSKFQVVGFDDGIKDDFSYSLTNFFHGISVYPQHILEDGTLSENFYTQRTKIFRKRKPLGHHPLAIKNEQTKTYSQPLYCIWMGEKVSCRFARVYIMSHLYERLVSKLVEFRKLSDLRAKGANLLIGDLDGFDFKEHGYKFREYADFPEGSWGASHMLYGMLKDKRPWNSTGLFDAQNNQSIKIPSYGGSGSPPNTHPD